MEQKSKILVSGLLVMAISTQGCAQNRFVFEHAGTSKRSSWNFDVRDTCQQCILDTAMVLAWNKQQPDGLYMTVDTGAVNLTAIMVDGLPNGLILSSGRSAVGGYLLLDVAGEYVRRMVLVYEIGSANRVTYDIIEVPADITNARGLRKFRPLE